MSVCLRFPRLPHPLHRQIIPSLLWRPVDSCCSSCPMSLAAQEHSAPWKPFVHTYLCKMDWCLILHVNRGCILTLWALSWAHRILMQGQQLYSRRGILRFAKSDVIPSLSLAVGKMSCWWFVPHLQKAEPGWRGEARWISVPLQASISAKARTQFLKSQAPSSVS